MKAVIGLVTVNKIDKLHMLWRFYNPYSLIKYKLKMRKLRKRDPYMFDPKFGAK